VDNGFCTSLLRDALADTMRSIPRNVGSQTVPNKRMFDVDVEGTAINDIVLPVPSAAITRLVTVTVSDGQLSIAFRLNVPKVTPTLLLELGRDHRALISANRHTDGPCQNFWR
jgi:hypothetical protein